MIESQNLTDILLKEARFFAQRMQFDDAAALMPDEKFARLLEMHPLPEPKEISSVFEEVFWASLLTEEGRAGGRGSERSGCSGAQSVAARIAARRRAAGIAHPKR